MFYCDKCSHNVHCHVSLCIVCSGVVSEGVIVEGRGGGEEEEEALFGSDDESNSTNEVYFT